MQYARLWHWCSENLLVTEEKDRNISFGSGAISGHSMGIRADFQGACLGLPLQILLLTLSQRFCCCPRALQEDVNLPLEHSFQRCCSL